MSKWRTNTNKEVKLHPFHILAASDGSHNAGVDIYLHEFSTKCEFSFVYLRCKMCSNSFSGRLKIVLIEFPSLICHNTYVTFDWHQIISEYIVFKSFKKYHCWLNELDCSNRSTRFDFIVFVFFSFQANCATKYNIYISQVDKSMLVYVGSLD